MLLKALLTMAWAEHCDYSQIADPCCPKPAANVWDMYKLRQSDLLQESTGSRGIDCSRSSDHVRRILDWSLEERHGD